MGEFRHFSVHQRKFILRRVLGVLGTAHCAAESLHTVQCDRPLHTVQCDRPGAKDLLRALLFLLPSAFLRSSDNRLRKDDH